jgi:hypothetical protein
METRKIVVKVEKQESLIEKPKTGKQLRYEKRIEERRANKKLNKTERLKQEGKRFVSFVVEIAFFNKWIDLCEKEGMKPNERFYDLLAEDMEGVE